MICDGRKRSEKDALEKCVPGIENPVINHRVLRGKDCRNVLHSGWVGEQPIPVGEMVGVARPAVFKLDASTLGPLVAMRDLGSD